jgi:SNF2 family DNA or RNA helicase
LRGYQLEGLSWLQFLRAFRLNGILADDMGLGKTLQAIAHILKEKEEGRLTNPVLVVVPTSLMFNWLAELTRFAPSLEAVAYHGAERAGLLEQTESKDIVLTTYGTLARDVDVLSEMKFHLLILDEAQAIKNHRSQNHAAVKRIQAQHRLALTGTPLENHLGELWAQFSVLAPGLLSDLTDFQRQFRSPIEKDRDPHARVRLHDRIRPFILRRSKDAVAKELPAKTEIVQRVDLKGGQRDLYEAVRVAVDSRVLAEVRARGFGRSSIVVLDALLKLRQVCCDPRLVPLERARLVKQSAKLKHLRELVLQALEEGRRILVFSQFTSMLSLIEEELAQSGVQTLSLTGKTRNRAAVVRAFQNGEVPVMLISLKAGGTGLNLTAADTVIHYDPWWNPAVERQATDRAHRIGQDKPVMVYKLIVAGSVEEKILEMQARKAELVDSLVGGDKLSALITQDDLRNLFAPLGS